MIPNEANMPCLCSKGSFASPCLRTKTPVPNNRLLPSEKNMTQPPIFGGLFASIVNACIFACSPGILQFRELIAIAIDDGAAYYSL
jgi:hypothetical protein